MNLLSEKAGLNNQEKLLFRIALFLILTLLLLSNRWMSFEEGRDFLAAADSLSFESIAASAPHFPADPIPYQHAQRWVPAYLVGLSAKVFSIPLGLAFQFMVFFLVLAIVRTLSDLAVRITESQSASLILAAALILNPYLFRYYLIVSGLLPDLFFVFGLTLITRGLFVKGEKQIIFGLIIASLGRQSSLLVLPGLAYWIYSTRKELKRTLWVRMSALAIPVILYVALGKIGTKFATPSHNLEHLFGLGNFVSKHLSQTSTLLKGFVEHALRLLLPHLAAFALMDAVFLRLKLKQKFELIKSPLFITFGLIWLGIIAQPFMNGPDPNHTRLSVIAFPATWALLLLSLRTQQHVKITQWKIIILIGFLFLSSLHHKFTLFGPTDSTQLVIYALGICMALFAVFWRMLRVV